MPVNAAHHYIIPWEVNVQTVATLKQNCVLVTAGRPLPFADVLFIVQERKTEN